MVNTAQPLHLLPYNRSRVVAKVDSILIGDLICSVFML